MLSLPPSPRRTRFLVLFALLAAFTIGVLWRTEWGATIAFQPTQQVTLQATDRGAGPGPEVAPKNSASPHQEPREPVPRTAFEEDRLRDIQLAATEETRVLTSFLSLSPDQQAKINELLVRYRYATDPPQESEQRALTKLLNPEQVRLYSDYLEHERRADAEQAATTHLRSVERVTGPLTDVQKDALYSKFLARDLEEAVISDADILREILNEQQFILWSKSRRSTPVDISP